MKLAWTSQSHSSRLWNFLRQENPMQLELEDYETSNSFNRFSHSS